MSAHIEWANARYVTVEGTARPGEFENDGSANDVAAIKIVTGDVNWGGGDGFIVEGTPQELIVMAEQILHAAQETLITTMNYPELRSLYGMV